MLLKTILLKLEQQDELKEMIKREKERYLKFEDIYKLRLLGGDERFFREHIIDGKVYPHEVLTPPQKRLKNAMRFFQQKVEQVKDIEVLKQMKLKIDNMEILVFLVSEESEASCIFTVVNDRGKLLTNLEKIKSF